MIQVPVRISPPVSGDRLSEMNRLSRPAVTARSVLELNRSPAGNAEVPSSGRSPERLRPDAPAPGASPLPAASPAKPPPLHMPALLHPMQKGQKASLGDPSPGRLEVRLGWNVKNPACDVDVSAFLLDSGGRVPGDDWFVFYGQPSSPDFSVRLSDACEADRQLLLVDLRKLAPSVERIVFALTINDALPRNLNFSMLENAYIRILDAETRRECASFPMTDYYSNAVSMMIGELYLYKGTWKFNAVGSGVAQDLAGLCGLYGIQVL